MFDALIETLVQSAVVVLVPMIVAAVVQVLRRLRIQLSAEQEAALTVAVRRAVLEAEEWAATRIKAKLPATSYQKLTRATESLIQPFGLTHQEAETRIKAILPELGLGASANFPGPPSGPNSLQP